MASEFENCNSFTNTHINDTASDSRSFCRAFVRESSRKQYWSSALYIYIYISYNYVKVLHVRVLKMCEKNAWEGREFCNEFSSSVKYKRKNLFNRVNVYIDIYLDYVVMRTVVVLPSTEWPYSPSVRYIYPTICSSK